MGLIGAVSYFLLMEHRQHLFAALPFLILLACPLMHIFMHSDGGNDRHHHHRPPADDALDETYRRGVEDGRRERHRPEE